MTKTDLRANVSSGVSPKPAAPTAPAAAPAAPAKPVEAPPAASAPAPAVDKFEGPRPAPSSKTAVAEALLAKYRPHHEVKLTRPLERMLNVANYVEEMALGQVDREKAARGEPDKALPERIARLMQDRDLRRQVFLLEYQLLMYSNKFGKPFYKEYENVKALEDLLGNASLYKQLVALATEKRFPPSVIEQLKKTQAGLNERLVDLVRERWTPGKNERLKGMNDVVDLVAKQDYGSYKDDQKFLRGQIADMLKRIEETDYDMDNVVKGIHPFRRRLREISVCVEATGGMIQLSPELNPLPQFEPMLRDPLASSKFVQQPGPEGEASVVNLSKSLFTKYMAWILELGEIKDCGEPVEFLTKAWMDAGLARNEKQGRKEVLALLGDPKYDEARVFARAKVVYDEVKTSGLLRAMRKELEP